MIELYIPGTSKPTVGLGGKGGNLRRLSELGLPVPRWFCVSFGAFEAFVRPHRATIREALEGIGPAKNTLAIAAAAKAIQFSLRCQTVDPVLEASLHSAVATWKADQSFAVRSSASVEDAAPHSFAGLFETALNVKPSDVVDRVKNCWISAFSPAVLTYSFMNGVAPEDIQMAVVVQELVNAEKAGVLFQANPSGPLEEIVIVAGFGLGEGIVTDSVGTDTIYYDRYTKIMRVDKGDKTEQVAPAPGAQSGVVKIPVVADRQKVSVLEDDDVQALLSLSEAISSHFSDLQDVEWCLDANGSAWLLQTRPITAIAPGTLNLYDNSNISENYPGVSLPLSISFVKQAYFGMFYYVFRHNGYSFKDLQELKPAFENLVEAIEGRIYYNMSNWYAMASLAPFASILTIPALEDSIGTERRSNSEGRSRYRLAKLKGFGYFIGKYFSYGTVFKRYARRFDRLMGEAAQLGPQPSARAELEALERFLDRIFPVEQFARLSDTYMMIALRLVKLLIQGAGLHEAEALALVNGLLIGERDLESVRPVRSVEEMAAAVARDQDLRKRLSSAVSWPLLRADLAISYPTFLHLLEQHVQAFGDRSLAELKLETSTFREDPLKLIAIVLGQSTAGRTAERTLSSDQARMEAEQRFFSLFRGWRRPIARWLIRDLRRFLRSREFTRLNRSRYYGVVRSAYVRIANYLVEGGFLGAREDIFYLTISEVRSAAMSASGADAFAELVKARREEWTGFEARRPRNRIWLKGEVSANFIPQTANSAPRSTDDYGELRGTGCCPGEAQGAALVLHSPDKYTDTVGRILVAESTDPGWAFLIMNAAGLVMEKGSLLSHTAIIGRELGIPTIVGVVGATRRIPHGSLLRIDGALGRIELVSARINDTEPRADDASQTEMPTS